VAATTRTLLRFAALIAWASGTSACAHVAVYDRAKLAHPMMTAEGLEGPAVAHVLAVQEGATGGGSLSESGCGCN
jgi:hypothetical protein